MKKNLDFAAASMKNQTVKEIPGSESFDPKPAAQVGLLLVLEKNQTVKQSPAGLV